MSRFEELKKIDEDHHEMETSKTLLLDIVGEFMKNKKH